MFKVCRDIAVVLSVLLIGVVCVLALDTNVGTPIASTKRTGKVKPDGTSITITKTGTISASLPTYATYSAAGTVRPDGTTITVNGTGVITAVGELPAVPLPFRLMSTAGNANYVQRPATATRTAIAVFSNGTGNRLEDSNMQISGLQPSLGTMGTAGRYCVEESVLGVHGLNTCSKVIAGGTCSTTYLVDPLLGNMFTLTLNGACAIGVQNLAVGQEFAVKLTQSASTAPIFANTIYQWAGGAVPSFSTTATNDLFHCRSFDGTTLQCTANINVVSPE